MNIDARELIDTYDVNLYGEAVTGTMKEFELVNPLNNQSFTGRLYWNSNDGYDIYWDKHAPELAKRDFFESALDTVLSECCKNLNPNYAVTGRLANQTEEV